MNTEMKIDAAAVRRLRESQAWSQEQLATVAGIGVRTLQRVEAEGSASMETCMALAIAFGCLPVDLMKAVPVAIETTATACIQQESVKEPDRQRERWTAARLNALLCLLSVTISCVGIVLGNSLIEPSTRIFDLPVYDGFVFSLTAIFIVVLLTTPSAWLWATERWQSLRKEGATRCNAAR